MLIKKALLVCQDVKKLFIKDSDDLLASYNSLPFLPSIPSLQKQRNEHANMFIQ